MKLKTAVAVAVAGAFALPLAAQASAEADRMILAQQSGSTTGSAGAPLTSGTNAADRAPNTPKAEAGATARSGFAGVDKNGDGHISRQPREVYRLLVSCDAAYPGLIDETADAMRRVLPANKVSSYLAGWQAEITADDPRPLVRGLLFVGPKR